MFQPIYIFFEKINNTNHIPEWKSRGLPDESINPHATCDNSIAPSLNHFGFRIRRKFDGQRLKQDKVTFTLKTSVNIYIVYKINLWPFKVLI